MKSKEQMVPQWKTKKGYVSITDMSVGHLRGALIIINRRMKRLAIFKGIEKAMREELNRRKALAKQIALKEIKEETGIVLTEKDLIAGDSGEIEEFMEGIKKKGADVQLIRVDF